MYEGKGKGELRVDTKEGTTTTQGTATTGAATATGM